MLTKIIEEEPDEYQEYISLSGKLWVRWSLYDLELEKLLEDNEEVYVCCETSTTYIYKEGNREVCLEDVTFPAYFTREKSLKALREISKCLLEKYSSAKKIVFGKWSAYIVENNGEERPMYLGTDYEKHPENSIDAKIICPPKNNDILKLYDKVLLYHPEEPLYDVLYIFGEYFLHSFDHKIDNIIDATKSDENIRICRDLPGRSTIYESSHPEIKSYPTVEYVGKEPIELCSSPKIPKNAFLISDPSYDEKRIFMQFTKKGIIFSDGIYFSEESLGETKKPWYIVEKTEDGWDIYFYSFTDFDGHYRIIDGSLYIYSKEQRKHVKISFSPLENGFEKIKVVAGNNTIYVPKAILKDTLGLEVT